MPTDPRDPPVVDSTDLHPDVIGECRSAFRSGRPWTEIRTLRKDADGSDKHSCDRAMGLKECKAKATHVQYSSALGSPAYLCDDCAALQTILDDNLYADCEPIPDWWFEDRAKREQPLESEES